MRVADALTALERDLLERAVAPVDGRRAELEAAGWQFTRTATGRHRALYPKTGRALYGDTETELLDHLTRGRPTNGGQR